MPKMYGRDEAPRPPISRAESRAKLTFFLQRASDMTPAADQLRDNIAQAQEAAARDDYPAVHAAIHQASAALFHLSHALVDCSLLAGLLKLSHEETDP